MNRVVASLQRRLLALNSRRRKWQWVARHGVAVDTCPVFIVGAQRSGTGMLSNCLGKSPEFEDLGEVDPRAFDQYSLRDDDAIKSLITDCWYPYIVFKPLKDSHRVGELLALHPSAKAIWAYRHFEDRINSAVRKFGWHPVEVFELFKAGHSDRWQLQGISQEVREALTCRLNASPLSTSDGAALMWWVRNSLYYSQRLECDARVMLWTYDAFVAAPEKGLQKLLHFLRGNWDPAMLADVHDRSVRKDLPPVIEPTIREMCQRLYDRLEDTRKSSLQASASQ